jgi:hypothetical protein
MSEQTRSEGRNNGSVNDERIQRAADRIMAVLEEEGVTAHEYHESVASLVRWRISCQKIKRQ